MSTGNFKQLFGFGARLLEERNRLGLSQKNLAGALGKTFVTQSKYESEETKPDLVYLEGLDKLGADVYYIITGKRSENALTAEEISIIAGLRTLDLRGKAGVLALISGMAPQEQKVKNVFHGGIGQNVEGNITAPQTFTFGKDKT